MKKDQMKKKFKLVNKMFDRVNKKMKIVHTNLMIDYKKKDKVEDEVEKKKMIVEVKKMKKSLQKMKECKKNNEHVDLIERLTRDGDDLIKDDVSITSSDIMDLICTEHEMEEMM